MGTYAWRFKRNIGIGKGRSFCDKCKRKISWFDNIPLVSYLVLAGKSRCCKAKITFYYPLVEFLTGVVFAALPYFTNLCFKSSSCIVNNFGSKSIVFMAFVFVLLILIFLIDLLTLTIPDYLTFLFFGLVLFFSFFSGAGDIYARLFAGFVSATFLLVIVFITKGKGMGLGDVKLAIPVGYFLGYPNAFVWLYVSFLVGGLVAIILVVGRMAKLKGRIAFGPFLVIGLLITMVIGDSLAGYLFAGF